MEKVSVPAVDVTIPLSEHDDRLAVGWQRLTREEFLEAVSSAVLDTVQKHESEQAQKSSHSSRIHIPAE
jgi:hypothetical protein